MWGNDGRPSERSLLEALRTAVARFLIAPTNGNQERLAETHRYVDESLNKRRSW